MAYTVPTIIDGECVCRLCCRQQWESTYDCISHVWQAPVFVSDELIEGPCPEDDDWAPTVDPCVYVYYKYVTVPDVCKDCDDVAKIPPPAPDVGEPVGCCDDVCIYIWQSNPDCESNTWLPSTLLPPVECAAAGVRPGPFNVWFVDPMISDCPIYIQTTAILCDDVEDCPEEAPSSPTPPVPPELPLFYEGCCPLVCFERWGAIPNCPEDTWEEIVFEGFNCAPPGFFPVGWTVTPGNDCPRFYRETVNDCEIISDCEGFGEPPEEPPLPPSDYEDCCLCCTYCFVAVYDCDEHIWSVDLLDYRCVSCGAEGASAVCGFPPAAFDDWVQDETDPCVYFRVIQDGSLCDNELNCPSSIEFPPPPDIGEPPGCCDESVCYFDYFSLYDCDTETWSEPEILNSNCSSCLVYNEWWFPDPEGQPCRALYCQSELVECVDSSDCDPSPPPPPPAPEIPPLEACCLVCFYVWKSDSVSELPPCETWSTPQLVATICGDPNSYSFGAPLNAWYLTPGVPCEATYIQVGGPCDEFFGCPSAPFTPGGPDLDPASCCEDCCAFTWESEFDCTTNLWGTPFLVSTLENVSCAPDSLWSLLNDCTATKTTYEDFTTPPDCPSPTTPSAPTLAQFDGDGCCPCTECSGGQPSSSVSTAGVCTDCDGTMPFVSFNTIGDDCSWTWNAIGACTGQQVVVTYDSATGQYSITPTSAFGGAIGVPLSCVGGVITGVVTLPGVGGCTGDIYTLTFG